MMNRWCTKSDMPTRPNGSNRCETVEHHAALSFRFGSKPPVPLMRKRSMAMGQLCRGSPMTAVPPTAATQGSAGPCAQQRLRGFQRVNVWQHRPAAVAAYAQLATMCRCVSPTAPTPRGGAPWMPVPPAHSYSDCRNRMSASGARNFAILVSGGSSLASAFSFMARLASM